VIWNAASHLALGMSSKVRIGSMIVLAFVAASGVVAAIVSPIMQTAGDPEGVSLFRVGLLA